MAGTTPDDDIATIGKRGLFGHHPLVRFDTRSDQPWERVDDPNQRLGGVDAGGPGRGFVAFGQNERH